MALVLTYKPKPNDLNCEGWEIVCFDEHFRLVYNTIDDSPWYRKAFRLVFRRDDGSWPGLVYYQCDSYFDNYMAIPTYIRNLINKQKQELIFKPLRNS